MSSNIDPSYDMPPADVVDVDCELLNVSGEIASPTVTAITGKINTHVNDRSIHRSVSVGTLTTDGVSDFYTVRHNLGTVHLQVTFYDVTTVPQQILFVHWEPVSENEIRILPDVRLEAGRTIQILIQ